MDTMCQQYSRSVYCNVRTKFENSCFNNNDKSLMSFRSGIHRQGQFSPVEFYIK